MCIYRERDTHIYVCIKRERDIYLSIYLSLYIHIYMYVCIDIYIYIERERYGMPIYAERQQTNRQTEDIIYTQMYIHVAHLANSMPSPAPPFVRR